MKKFALIGVSGFVSERHLIAIKETGNILTLAYDVNKNLSLLKKYFPKCLFTTKLDNFEKMLSTKKIQYLSICSPNHLHLKHILIGLNNNLNIICEKPLVINGSQIKKIEKLPKNKKDKINSILQLRCHPSLIKMKKKAIKK
jgi:UDP-N-acetyl-2-amino-2-deoxyglucuronate dehydrogenase